MKFEDGGDVIRGVAEMRQLIMARLGITVCRCILSTGQFSFGQAKVLRESHTNFSEIERIGKEGMRGAGISKVPSFTTLVNCREHLQFCDRIIH